MKKRLFCLLAVVVLVLSMYGNIVFAEVREESTFLYRGGASFVAATPALKENGTGTSWCSNLVSVSVTGIPSGLIGSNYFVSRMRTNETETAASYTLTHSSSNYTYNGDNRLWQSYYSGFGTNGEYYKLAASMSSSSANLSGSVYYRYNP